MMQGIPNVLPGNRLQFVNETDSILSGGDGLVGREFLQTGPDSKFENFKLKRDSDETDDFLLPGHIPCKKTKGRVKIKMEYIDNKLRRYTTFSKRKTGIMKKAYELSKLTGTQVMLLVASETGHVYTFATQKLQPMITSEGGKTLIQTCLNSPDGFSPDDCVISDQDIAGIDTIRSCDIDLTVTNDLLTAEDIIEQADSLVPCDSTSFENCIPKDLINKILDNAEESSKSTFQQSPSIFPTYRQTSNSLTTGIHLQTTTTTNLVLQQQQQQTVTLQQHPPTAVPSHAHNNNNDCDDDRLVANEEDAFAGSSHRLVSLYKPPASQRRNADLTPRCGQLTAPVASAAAHHMTSDLLYASLTSSSDHSSPLDLDDSPLGGVADPLDGTTVGPGDDSSPLGTLDADGLHSRMMLGDSANGLKGSVQLFTPLAQHQTHQQLHLQHDQHGSPMIGNRRSLGKTPIRRSYKASWY